MDLEGETLGGVERQISAPAIWPVQTDQHHLVCLADGLAVERRELGVGEIEHEVIAGFLAVEPAGDGLRGELRVVWEDRGEGGRIDDSDLSKAG